jgi:transcriptional regulator with GAF, ATPase, and Fis domain
MIGQSAAMQELWLRIERFAPADVSILILGESGTGKELVAQAIQKVSPRRVRRFEVMNCGVLTRELLPSEFFGHERGAFTGAIANKVGLLEVADGGTLFLDEIGDLSVDAQTALLRFLQSGEIRAVGSTRTVRVDVRTISATNRDLEAAIAERTFREDLYYRLADVVLEVPPLRERREDIPLLVEHFRMRFNGQHQLAIDPLEPETLSALVGAPWRGNVRELERTMKVAMLFRREGGLRPEDLRVRGRPLSTKWVDDRMPPSVAHLPVSRRVQTALRIAGERGVVTRRDLIRECGVSGEIARQALGALERLGFLRRVGRGRSTLYVLR